MLDKTKIGRLGIWINIYADSYTGQIELVQQVENLGYGAIWVPDLVEKDPFVSLSLLAKETDKLFLATGIANIYTRAAACMAGTRRSLGELSKGRFILGLGVSHMEFISGILNMDYKKPVATMREYLEAMQMQPPRILDQQAESETSEDKSKYGMVVLAALGNKMLALAGEKADGAHPYLTTPEHTARAREILSPESFLAPEQMVLLEKDASTARAVARKYLAVYLGLRNYRNNLLSLGFSEEDFERGGSDRLVDALVAWGDETKIHKHLDAHWNSGADHVCIQLLRADGGFGYDQKALEAFAPGG